MRDLSGYLLIRTGGLVLLTLVATTLPADVVVPAPEEVADSTSPEEQAPASPESEPSNPPAPSSDPSRDPVTPASTPDTGESPSQGAGTGDQHPEVFRSAIWSGQDARSSFPGTPPSLMAELMARPRLSLCDPLQTTESIRIESLKPDLRCLRRWMACRFPHAPPVI